MRLVELVLHEDVSVTLALFLEPLLEGVTEAIQLTVKALLLLLLQDGVMVSRKKIFVVVNVVVVRKVLVRGYSAVTGREKRKNEQKRSRNKQTYLQSQSK